MIVYEAKDPADVADYSQGWAGVLNGDTVATIDAVAISPVTDPPLTEDLVKRSNDATNTTLWLAGGKPGEGYTVSVRITTAGGRTFERSAKLKVKEL